MWLIQIQGCPSYGTQRIGSIFKGQEIQEESWLTLGTQFIHEKMWAITGNLSHRPHLMENVEGESVFIEHADY
jgi:hypothetical protein